MGNKIGANVGLAEEQFFSLDTIGVFLFCPHNLGQFSCEQLLLKKQLFFFSICKGTWENGVKSVESKTVVWYNETHTRTVCFLCGITF